MVLSGVSGKGNPLKNLYRTLDATNVIGLLPAARTSTLPRPERHRGRSGPRRVPLRLSQTLPCARREGSQFPLLFVQYDNVVDAFALRVQAGLRGVHRLAIGRDCNSRRERWLAVYLAYDLERSVVYTLEGVGGIRCLDAATSTAVRLKSDDSARAGLVKVTTALSPAAARSSDRPTRHASRERGTRTPRKREEAP